MALTTTITPDDVAIALGVDAPTTGSPQSMQWAMWIGDALMLIQTRVDDLKAVEADVSNARLDYVIREAVVAQVRRPDQARQVTVTVDDASTSKTYSDSAGRVEIADGWWRMLGLAPSGGQAFSIDTTGPGTIHQPWCALNMGATYCSCGADLAGTPLWEF